MLFRKKDG